MKSKQPAPAPPVQSRPMAAACAAASPGPRGLRGRRGRRGDQPCGGESCTKLGPKSGRCGGKHLVFLWLIKGTNSG